MGLNSARPAREIDMDAERNAFPVRPTPERVARADDVEPGNYDDGSPTKAEPHVRKARLGTAWDRYSHPGKDGLAVLEAHQVLAGNQYAKEYDKAGYGKIAVGQFEPAVDGGSGKPESEYMWAARDRLAKAQRLLRPHELTLLQCVLLEGLPAKEWARRTGRHFRAGLPYLRDTLDVLATHYGLKSRKGDLTRGHSN